jgi:hypothetical protein
MDAGSMTNKIDDLLNNGKWTKKMAKVEETKVKSIGRLRDAKSENEEFVNFDIISSFRIPTKLRHFRKGKLGDTGPKPYFDKFLNGGMPRNKKREPHGHYHH